MRPPGLVTRTSSLPAASTSGTNIWPRHESVTSKASSLTESAAASPSCLDVSVDYDGPLARVLEHRGRYVDACDVGTPAGCRQCDVARSAGSVENGLIPVDAGGVDEPRRDRHEDRREIGIRTKGPFLLGSFDEVCWCWRHEFNHYSKRGA